MSDLNQFIVGGKVTGVYPNDNGVNSSLAIMISTDDSYKEQSGTWNNRSYLLRMTAFGKYVDTLRANTEQGDLVVIEGKITSKKDDTTNKHVLYLNINKVTNYSLKMRQSANKPASAKPASNVTEVNPDDGKIEGDLEDSLF